MGIENAVFVDKYAINLSSQCGSFELVMVENEKKDKRYYVATDCEICCTPTQITRQLFEMMREELEIQ